MRVKTDFVTNSSSTSYILVTSEKFVKKIKSLVKKYDKMEEASNEGVRIYHIFKNKKQLFEFVNGAPLDWVNECTGPCFENMSEEDFVVCKKAIEEGSVLIYMAVDYNVSDQFEVEAGRYANVLVSYS